MLTLLGEGEGNTVNRHKTYQVSASHLPTLRSHRPCACGDVFYAELGRSNSLFANTNSLLGSLIGVANKYNGLEVRQTHSSEEACEQNINENWCGGVGGAKGADREKVI